MSIKRQIVALGGGGFLMEPDNPLLDKYILALSGKARPKICFIPTASGDAQVCIDQFYTFFKKQNCEPSYLSLFKGSTSEIESFVLEQDILYVGGGNTRNLIALWKEWQLDQMIRKAYEQGAILSGISAGSICWFEQGVTDSIPGKLTALTCLGFLTGSNCPHYDGEKERRPSYQRLLKQGFIKEGIAAEDGVGLHFVNEELFKVISSHPDKSAYQLLLKNGEPEENEMRSEYLGGKDLLIRRAALTDARAIHEAHMKSIREVCGPDYSPEEIAAWGGRDFKEDERLQAIKDNFVWVVEDDGKIEGYAHMNLGMGEAKNEAYVFGLYFTPKVTGKGLGSRIIDLMDEELRQTKTKIVALESTITALSFYRKHGFKEKGPQVTVLVNGMQIRCHPMIKIL